MVTGDEEVLLGKLADMDVNPKPRRNPLGKLASAADIDPAACSAKQLEAYARYLVKKGKINPAPPKWTAAVLLPLVQQVIVLSPLAELKLGLKKAMELAAAAAPEYTKHHAAAMRVLGENYGVFPLDFKEWVATRSMFNFINHKQNDHRMCGKFLHFSRCHLPAEKYMPRHAAWTDYDGKPYPGAKGSGGKYMSGLVGALFAAWTASSYMVRNVKATLHNPRSSRAEGVFSENSKWNFKAKSYSDWGYDMGFSCVVLVHNEMAERRQVTSSHIRTHRRHRSCGYFETLLPLLPLPMLP